MLSSTFAWNYLAWACAAGGGARVPSPILDIGVATVLAPETTPGLWGMMR